MIASAAVATSEDATGLRASLARVLDVERAGLAALTAAFAGSLGDAMCAAAETIRVARGRLVLTGVGKSGHIGRKLTATFASTGTPALFVHASEASHGDLGMITSDDVVLALSASGESAELAAIISYTRRFRVPLIAMTTNPASTLGRAADIVIALPKVDEACPHGLAPTSSTLLQLAAGDALAVALLEARGFSAQDFGVFHPGGKLGASLKRVADIMHVGDRLPLIGIGATVRDAILVMSAKGFGCVGIIAPDGRLAGIVTDGDLRRHLAPDVLEASVERLMTRDPKVTTPETLLGAAIEMLNTRSITALIVVDADRYPVGIIHLHDLLRAGVA
jgi:arabinose-5-phosphate isomerase